jgi:hypothetical protein
MKPPQWLGAAILASVLVIVLAKLGSTPGPPTPPVTVVQGLGGNLKVAFLGHPEVQRILRDDFGLEIEFRGGATTEIACPSDPHAHDEIDFLWLGEQSQIPIYEKCMSRDDDWDNIFLSPMVIYSWADIIDALVQEGVARQDASGAYFVDMPKLLALLESDKTWKDIGFPHQPNQVKVYPTDPDGSSSGRSFAALLGNTMNCLQVVDSSTIATVLSSIFDYYQEIGYLEPSSKDMFESYMTQGMGGRPMVALIESQISEYLYDYKQSHTEAEYQAEVKKIQDNVRMLYPEPTVWTAHPVVARTELGERVMKALLDPRLQALGWEVSGFRPAVSGVGIDMTQSAVPGILPQIDSVIDMPGEAAMELIKDATKNDPGKGAPRRNCTNVAPAASPSAP